MSIIRERLVSKEISIFYHQPAVLYLLEWICHNILPPYLARNNAQYEVFILACWTSTRRSFPRPSSVWVFLKICIPMIARRWLSVLFNTDTPIDHPHPFFSDKVRYFLSDLLSILKTPPRWKFCIYHGRLSFPHVQYTRSDIRKTFFCLHYSHTILNKPELKWPMR